MNPTCIVPYIQEKRGARERNVVPEFVIFRCRRDGWRFPYQRGGDVLPFPFDFPRFVKRRRIERIDGNPVKGLFQPDSLMGHRRDVGHRVDAKKIDEMSVDDLGEAACHVRLLIEHRAEEIQIARTEIVGMDHSETLYAFSVWGHESDEMLFPVFLVLDQTGEGGTVQRQARSRKTIADGKKSRSPISRMVK